MRDILFKAKRIYDGKWVEGSVYRISEKHNPFIMLKDSFGESYEVDEDTICQYTGLTDKNRSKIWENDILMFHSNKNDLAKACYGEFYVINAETLEKIDSVIGWHYEVIETDAISKCEPFNIPMPLTNDYIKTCELEAVGNIFDNPELIGE